MKEARFSIIMPSYNHEGLISDAIDSVLRQTYQNFEIIIVEDGSVDRSLAIIQKYQKQYPEIIQVAFHPNRENRGIYETYQLGISMSKGEYLAFLEVDDFWDSHYLEKKQEIFMQHPNVGVVFSPYHIVRESMRGIEMSFRQWLLHLFLPKNQPFDNFQNLLRKNNVATFSSIAIRRSELSYLAKPFDTRILFYDWWFLGCLSLQSLFYLDTSSCIYWRQHKTSALGKQSFEKHKKVVIDFYKNLYDFIETQIDCLDTSQRNSFEREKKKLTLFTRFYQKPGLVNSLQFFLRDPQWSLESFISYFINFIKYSGFK